MPREFDREEKSGLLEVYLEKDECNKIFYSLRDKNNQSKEGFIRIVPENIHHPVLIKAEGVGDGGGHGAIDSEDLKHKCPKGCNAYFTGEAVEFESHTVVHIKDINWRDRYAHLGDKERMRRGYRLVNFCKVPESYLKQ